jgi:hypothetical protein
MRLSGRALGRLGACAFTALLAATAAACGNSGASEGALQGKSATSITGQSITAFHRQQSVSFVTKTLLGKTTTIEAGATTREGPAAETVTTNGQPVIDAVLVNQVAYLRATSAVLQNSLKLSASEATAYEGKWISLTVADPEYETVVNSLRPTQAIDQFVPEEPNLRVAGVTSIGGRSAVAVTGSTGAQVAAGDTALTTLFVSTTAPYLPISSTIVVKSASGTTAERLASVYGKYNERVDPIAPTGATPISSISS